MERSRLAMKPRALFGSFSKIIEWEVSYQIHLILSLYFYNNQHFKYSPRQKFPAMHKFQSYFLVYTYMCKTYILATNVEQNKTYYVYFTTHFIVLDTRIYFSHDVRSTSNVDDFLSAEPCLNAAEESKSQEPCLNVSGSERVAQHIPHNARANTTTHENVLLFNI